MRKYAAWIASMADPSCSGWNSALTWRFACCRSTLSGIAVCPVKLTATSFSIPVSTNTSRNRPSGIVSAYAATRENRALACRARIASRSSRASSGRPGWTSTSERTDSASAPSNTTSPTRAGSWGAACARRRVQTRASNLFALTFQVEVDAQVGPGRALRAADVLVVDLEAGGERIRQLVADHPAVPPGGQALQDLEVELLGEQLRLEARHRLQPVGGVGEVAGEVDARVAQDRVLGNEPLHLGGEPGRPVQGLDADRQPRVRRRERGVLDGGRDEADRQQRSDVALRQRRIGVEQDVRLAGSAEGVQLHLVGHLLGLDLGTGLQVEAGPDPLAVGEGEDALLDLELVAPERGGPADGIHAAQEPGVARVPGDLEVPPQIGAG